MLFDRIMTSIDELLIDGICQPIIDKEIDLNPDCIASKASVHFFISSVMLILGSISTDTFVIFANLLPFVVIYYIIVQKNMYKSFLRRLLDENEDNPLRLVDYNLRIFLILLNFIGLFAATTSVSFILYFLALNAFTAGVYFCSCKKNTFI